MALTHKGYWHSNVVWLYLYRCPDTYCQICDSYSSYYNWGYCSTCIPGVKKINSLCEEIICGDGILIEAVESCDDKKNLNGGCNPDCKGIKTGYTCTNTPD